MTAQPRSPWFVLTNAHGLRLAIQSGRLGCPPRSASAPRDISSHFGGLPVLTRGSIPSAIEGVEGPLVGLRVLATAVHGATSIPGSTAYYAVDPIPMKAVRAAHFESATARDEFLAGLRVIDPDAPFPGGQAGRAVSAEAWPTIASADAAVDRGTSWGKQLARQERVSAALVLLAAVADDVGSLGQTLDRVRAGEFDAELTGLRDLATALARLDEINGWTGEELAAILESLPDPQVPGLASFVRATLAAQDPFGDAIAPRPTGPAETALSALLPTAGLATPEAAAYVIDSIRRSGTSEAAAMAGFAFSRTMLPRRLRARELDQRLVDDEIRAAKRRVQSTASSTVKRRPRKSRAVQPGESLSLGL